MRPGRTSALPNTYSSRKSWMSWAVSGSPGKSAPSRLLKELIGGPEQPRGPQNHGRAPLGEHDESERRGQDQDRVEQWDINQIVGLVQRQDGDHEGDRVVEVDALRPMHGEQFGDGDE